jgi:hypothetical protein
VIFVSPLSIHVGLVIDAKKISPKIDQGPVTLILPKAEHVKPRKIAVS